MSIRSLLRGWMGEVQTSVWQGLVLEKKTYVQLNNLTFSARDGTTQIDHVIVSKFGIFVVETKKMSGWIFGDERSAEWTQSIYGRKFRFQNPLRQNYRHIKVLSELLSVPEDKFHSVVVFWGGAEFKTAVPPQVLTKGYGEYIKGKSAPILDESDVDRIVDALGVAALPKTLKTRLDHIKGLKSRHEHAEVCPKCGGKLVLRTSKTGTHPGTPFYGCSSFPRCRYIRNA